MPRYQGGMIASLANNPDGTNYTGKANGVFSLSQQIVYKRSSIWAIGQTIPNPPSIGTAASTGATSISVAFIPPVQNGGSNITSYTVTSSGGQTATGASSPIVVSGLASTTSYTFTVTATNALGTSASSGTSNSLRPNDNPTELSLAGGINITINKGWLSTRGWDGINAIPVTITNTADIRSSTTSAAALIFDADLATLPSGSFITFVNNSGIYIAGRGGNGSGWGGGWGSAAAAGGTAVQALAAVRMVNHGIIGGGGGGGNSYWGAGGGGWGGGNGSTPNDDRSGAGGGGAGGGLGGTAAGGNGSAGSASLSGAGGSGAYAGGAGGSSLGGGGGGGSQLATPGGTGGSAGSNGTQSGYAGGGGGSAGAAGGAANSGGAGGAGGAAVEGNSYITWLATGTRYGSIG